MFSEWLWLAGLAAIGWFWWDSLQKRELALQAAQQACARAGVQLLDGSVALKRLRLGRDENQRARFQREFAFEYSTVGDDRQAGRVFLLGAEIVSIGLIESAR